MLLQWNSNDLKASTSPTLAPSMARETSANFQEKTIILKISNSLVSRKHIFCRDELVMQLGNASNASIWEYTYAVRPLLQRSFLILRSHNSFLFDFAVVWQRRNLVNMTWHESLAQVNSSCSLKSFEKNLAEAAPKISKPGAYLTREGASQEVVLKQRVKCKLEIAALTNIKG